MVSIRCPKCKSYSVARKGFRYNKSGKKQKYQCTIKNCKTWFIYDDGFKRMRKPKEAIVRAIHQFNDGLSLSKIQNHLYQHDNVDVSCPGILYWVKKYSDLIKKNSTRM